MKRRKRITRKPGAPDMRVEQRQSKLAENSEAIERWQRRLFRAATELQKLVAQRKRLLKPPGGKLKYQGEVITGMGGGAVEDSDLNDAMPF
jgi:hypothetical protein